MMDFMYTYIGQNQNEGGPWGIKLSCYYLWWGHNNFDNQSWISMHVYCARLELIANFHFFGMCNIRQDYQQSHYNNHGSFNPQWWCHEGGCYFEVIIIWYKQHLHLSG
jgi:hypothetical protein